MNNNKITLKEIYNNKESFYWVDTDYLNHIELIDDTIVFYSNNDDFGIDLNDYNIKSINNFLKSDESEYVTIDEELDELLKRLNLINNINNF